MPLSSGNLDNLLKRHCGGLLVSGRALPSPPGASVAMSSSPVQISVDVDHHHDVLLNLPVGCSVSGRCWEGIMLVSGRGWSAAGRWGRPWQ